MGLTGKYNFKGIKEKGASALEKLLIASWAPFATAMGLPVIGPVIDWFLKLMINWLANKGLVVLNVGDIIVEGKWDQKNFDDAMEKALASVDLAHDQLTDEQRKRIDDSVIAAFRKFAPITYEGTVPSGDDDGLSLVPNVQGVGLPDLGTASGERGVLRDKRDFTQGDQTV